MNEIFIQADATCDLSYGYINSVNIACGEVQGILVHEILHNHDDEIISSPFCPQNKQTCSRMDAFVEAARKDGLTFHGDKGVINGNVPASY